MLVALLAFTACRQVEPEDVSALKPNEDAKVTISFPVAIPTDGPATKAMANKPDVKNIYVAVFGSGGYFSEWVPAEWNEDGTETQYATENEVIYNLKVKLTTSQSRLSLHIIANCPLAEPPITGISSDDMETVVMSKVRSKIGVEPNDAYWQKIILPFGVKDSVVVTNGVEQPFLINGERVPTMLTVSQFAHWNPIPLVRNFARIRVIKDASLSNVQIDRIGLAYAPAEGPVAPLLPNTYTANQWGSYITIADDDDETQFWNESFYMDYPNRTLETIGAAPYNYKGYSPADLALGTYPASLEEMKPWSEATAADTYLYLYERAKPRPGQKSTRVLIHAKNGTEDWKYYALDLVDANSEPEAFLRNFTYTLTVKQLAGGSGEPTIAQAADATAADVSADPRATDLNEVSDGVALIAASYIDTTAIKAGVYSVMYRFVPDVETKIQVNNPSTTSNPEGVSLQFGYNNGVDGFVEGANSANGNAFASNPTIELNTDGTAKLYVRSGNGWAAATTAQINDVNIEKWSKINYTTVGTAGSYFEVGYTKTIRVIGNYVVGTSTGRVYRDIQINLIPRKNMIVQCLDKYIEEVAGAAETVRIIIPHDITRSMFPLEFKIQAAASSLTPREGDNLPVSSGKSIIPGQTTQSAFFFIKTLTRSDYESARDTTIGGVQMKYFDCKFKSSKATSATTVYVQNDYFNEGNDSFENFILRKFTGNAPGTLSMGESTTFTFNMDEIHGSASNRVWNDADNLSASVKVIPRIVTVTMVGIQPETDDEGHYVDTKLSKGEGTGVYLYHVAGEAAPAEQTVTLHLTAGASTSYSITLSTDNISPNPSLYENFTVTGEVTKSRLTNMGFVNGSGESITRVLALAGESVNFKFTYGGELVPVIFKLQGLVTSDGRVSGPDGSGNYTFTPTGTGKDQTIAFITTDATTTCSLLDLAVNDETYDNPSPDSFSLSRFTYGITLPATSSVAVGRTRTLTPTVTPTDAPAPTIVWSSDNTSIATVNESGVVTGVALGTANVTASIVINGTTVASATTAVTVRNPYYTIEKKAGNTTYGWTNYEGNPHSSQYYGYQSTNEGQNSTISTMSVTIVGYTEFTIYIRSYAESYYDYVIVRRLGDGPLTSWTASDAYSGVKAHTRNNQQGGTAINNYTAVTFTTADGLTEDETPHTFYIQYGKVYRTSSNADLGYVLIPKEYNYVYIPVSVTGVSLNQTTADVTRGGTLQLTATVAPSNADNQIVTWSSSNTSVATVSDDGLVTVASGAAVGSTATITVTTDDGNHTASCVVTVVRRKVTGTATFTSSDFSSGTNKTATKGPIKLDVSRVSGSYGNYIQISGGNNSILSFTPISNESFEEATITDITITFLRYGDNYNPTSITGPFSGGTGNGSNDSSLNATYNGGETNSVVTTTLTARNNRSTYMQITVEYYYFE